MQAEKKMSETYPLPTGYLFVNEYSKGQLETLSIGDYGKRHNVKADFLGYTKDIEGVPNVPCMPLSEKWVITLSTQYGCPMRCTFCDVPKVKWRGNASFSDLEGQLFNALSLFPGVEYTERLNIHFARMGDPIFNKNVFDFSRWLYEEKSKLGLRIETLHPVLTTSCPKKFSALQDRLLEWSDIKNNVYNGQAGLQLSINSTSDEQRDDMFSGLSADLETIAAMCAKLPDPIGRKYCLNFAYATGYEIDANKLSWLFDPSRFMVKITPIHNNNACRENGIESVGAYSSYSHYKQAEEDLKLVGYDVLVFVPSLDEEQGLVTCGNAILGGSKLKNESQIINIQGM